MAEVTKPKSISKSEFVKSLPKPRSWTRSRSPSAGRPRRPRRKEPGQKGPGVIAIPGLVKIKVATRSQTRPQGCQGPRPKYRDLPAKPASKKVRVLALKACAKWSEESIRLRLIGGGFCSAMDVPESNMACVTEPRAVQRGVFFCAHTRSTEDCTRDYSDPTAIMPGGSTMSPRGDILQRRTFLTRGAAVGWGCWVFPDLARSAPTNPPPLPSVPSELPT